MEQEEVKEQESQEPYEDETPTGLWNSDVCPCSYGICDECVRCQ